MHVFITKSVNEPKNQGKYKHGLVDVSSAKKLNKSKNLA